MDRFSKTHPMVQFVFFGITFLTVLTVNNPFFSIICLSGAILYRAKNKCKSILKSVLTSVILIVTTAVFNMLFVHYGKIVFFEINALPCTAESFLYGANQGVILSAVILWFISFGELFDSEKIIYIFRFAPKIALIFSMVLGFIPRFNRKIKQIREAKQALKGCDGSTNFREKINNAVSTFSALITYSLESSIITAQSISARKYNPKAISLKRYKYTLFDILSILFLIILCTIIIFEKSVGHISFTFNPTIKNEYLSKTGIACFAVIQLFPLFIDLWEDMQWKLSNAKT